MVGAIVKRDIIAHPVVTIRCFGWRVFWRALWAGSRTTFLSLLAESEALAPAPEGVANFVARCVELELKANRIYSTLSRRFAEDGAVRDFFKALARQENSHAELLELAESAASQERWDEQMVAPWRSAVPELERKMAKATEAVAEIRTVRAALEHVLAIEMSEINDVFNSVIAASDACFVRRIRAFHDAERCHLQFICRSIESLEPELAEASRALVMRCAA